MFTDYDYHATAVARNGVIPSSRNPHRLDTIFLSGQ
jgi:hypothetical protein